MKNIVELESGKSLLLTSYSSRELVLEHHILSETSVIKNDNKEISSLTIDNFEIKIGTILQVKLFNNDKVPFKVLHISKKKNNAYSLFSTKLTKASRWIMPMLRTTNQTYTSMKYSTHFVNCYVGIEGSGYMPEIYLAYRFSGSVDYTVFEKSLKCHELYDRTIEIDDFHSMYVFSMTKEHINIFSQFIRGEYSKFPDNYKKKIINFVVNPSEYPSEEDIQKTITHGVLYKTVMQRERIENLINQPLPKGAEYFSVPEEEQEIYDGSIKIERKSILDKPSEKSNKEMGID